MKLREILQEAGRQPNEGEFEIINGNDDFSIVTAFGDPSDPEDLKDLFKWANVRGAFEITLLPKHGFSKKVWNTRTGKQIK